LKIHWPLVVIDFLVLVAFSYGGLKFHYEGGALLAEVTRVISPFLFGFLIAGLPLKAYELPESGRVYLRRGAGIWALGMGIGFVLRGIQRGVMPNTLFIQIALAFTGVLMLLGRGVYWAVRGRHLSR
jgi:DUF3054 family protein